jgi:hypothetical protein
MLRLVLVKVWGTLAGSRSGVGGAETAPGASKINLAPLPIVIRLDTDRPLRDRGTVETSGNLWICSDPQGGAVKALEAVVCPN